MERKLLYIVVKYKDMLKYMTEDEQVRFIELVKKADAGRDADGCYDDDELLAECMSVLEYATYHDGRYRQDQNYEEFQQPAQRLVGRLAKRLQRKAYDGLEILNANCTR